MAITYFQVVQFRRSIRNDPSFRPMAERDEAEEAEVEGRFFGDFLTIDAVKFFDSDEDIIDVLSDIRGVEEPDFFNRQTVSLDVEDREDIGISLLAEESNNMRLHVGDEQGEFHVHATFTPDNFDPFLFMFNKVLDIIANFTIQTLTGHYHIHLNFSKLCISPPEDLDGELVGVRVERDEGNYIIQKSLDDEDITHVLFKANGEYDVEGLMDEDDIDEILESAEEYIESIIPEHAS